MSEHKYNEAYNKGFYDGRKSACWECYDELSLSERVDLMVKRGVFIPNILDKIRAEIERYKSAIDNAISEDELKIEGMKEAYADCLNIIDKYKE